MKKNTISSRLYVALSGIFFVLDYLMSCTLLSLGFSPTLSLGLSICLMTLLGYYTFSYIVSKDSTRQFKLRQFLMYCGSIACLYLARLFTFKLWVYVSHDMLEINFIGLALSYIVSFMVNFIILNKIVFKRTSSASLH